MPLFTAFISGLLLSIGIALSGMIDPAKVLGFLNVLGNWDPSLALVMVGALVVYTLGFRLIQHKSTPIFTAQFYLPTQTKIDRPLLVGASLFGIGWGLVGYCPGPAIAAISTGSIGTLGFVLAMISGWFIARHISIK